MRRSALWPLLPAAVLALAACGSDTTVGSPGSTTPPSGSTSASSSAAAIPACSQISNRGTTPTDPGKVLCVKTAGVSPLGTKGGVVRITVKDVYRAESYSLDELKVSPSAKSGKDLWFVDTVATIIKPGADLDATDPAQAINLGYDGDRVGSTARGTELSGCAGNTFIGSGDGATMTSCAWALLPAGQRPTTVTFLGKGGTEPTVTWAARS